VNEPWTPIDFAVAAGLATALVLPQLVFAALATVALSGMVGEMQSYFQRRLVSWWTGKKHD